jgi:hypothetical protein
MLHQYFNASIWANGKIIGTDYTVTSTHELNDGVRGTIRRNGKTYAVQFNEASVAWHLVTPAKTVTAR